MERTRRRLYEEDEPTQNGSNSVLPKDSALPRDNNDPGEEKRVLSLKGNLIVQDAVALSMGFSLVPIPLVSSLTLTGIQMRMVKRLARLYDIPFEKEFTKTFLSSLFGGATGVLAGRGASTVLSGVFPPLGFLLGGASVAAFGGAASYAVGELFHTHFRSGGTFFDIEKQRFQERFKVLFADRLSLPR